MKLPEHCRATRYEIRLVDDEYNAYLFIVSIEDRGRGWAICHGRRVLNHKRQWEYEPLPSSRTKAFFKRCRWPIEEALAVAAEVAPTITVNGWTVEAANERARERRETGDA